jgi:hypothetical protein
MAFDWREFLTLARSLHTQLTTGSLGSTEAVFRTLVGRAYYAAYGYAHDYAESWLAFIPRRKPEERSQDHGRLRAHLHNRRRRAVADRLTRLRDWRNECDYLSELSGINISQRTEDAIASAEYVITALPPPKTT